MDASIPVATKGTALWYEPAERRPRLDGDTDVDVAIVGAGYTGLWTAYYLLRADPGLRVAVIEREYAGYGASGRNGGWASAIFPVSLPHVAKTSSKDAAIRLQLAMNDTVDEIGWVVREEGIDADYAKEGFLSLARSCSQLERARRTVHGSEAFGTTGQWELFDEAEARAVVNAEGVLGGVYTPHCAIVHPGRLVRGLAATVERLGGRIYEGTEGISLEPGIVGTRYGVVHAPVVVRATEGYTSQFPHLKRAVVPLYSLVLATEPLPQDVLKKYALTHRHGFNDLRHLRIYAQVTQDGRLVFGGRGAPYHFGSQVSEDYDVVDTIHRKIQATMLEFFPDLQGARITHRWGGPLGVPRDWHPSVGLDTKTGMAWAGPYVGDGVATSNLAARVLRNLILRQPDDLNDLPIVDHRSPSWEVEPLRWLAVNAGLRAAASADAEERITGRPSRIARLLESLTGAH